MPPARGRTASANSQSPVTLEPCWGEEGPCGSTMGPREHRHPAALGEGLGHLPWQPPMPRGDARAPGSLLPPSFTPLPSSRLHSLLRVCLAGCLFLALLQGSLWTPWGLLCGKLLGLPFLHLCFARLWDCPLRCRGLAIPPFRRYYEFTFPLYAC